MPLGGVKWVKKTFCLCHFHFGLVHLVIWSSDPTRMVVPIRDHRFKRGRQYECPADYGAPVSQRDPLDLRFSIFTCILECLQELLG